MNCPSRTPFRCVRAGARDTLRRAVRFAHQLSRNARRFRRAVLKAVGAVPLVARRGVFRLRRRRFSPQRAPRPPEMIASGANNSLCRNCIFPDCSGHGRVEFVAYFALPAAPFRVACVAEFWPPQLLKGKKGPDASGRSCGSRTASTPSSRTNTRNSEESAASMPMRLRGCRKDGSADRKLLVVTRREFVDGGRSFGTSIAGRKDQAIDASFGWPEPRRQVVVERLPVVVGEDAHEVTVEGQPLFP